MTTRYRCEHSDCSFGFGTAFYEDSEQATRFKELIDVSADCRMADLLECRCGGIVYEIYVEVARAPTPDERVSVAGGESYGALILCCDLSGSMDRFVDNTKLSRYKAVVQAVSMLLRDFGGKTDVRADKKVWYSEGTRSLQYNRLLISIVRFGNNCSVLNLPGPGSLVTPWFTVKMLAEQEQWPVETQGHRAGYFALPAIMETVARKLLPVTCVERGGTNLRAVLEALRELSFDLYSTSDVPQKRGLPADFGMIGNISNAVDHDQLWAAIYTDGEITGTVASTEKALDDLVRAVPAMHRITAFFGTKALEDAARGGLLLRKIASVCYAKHDEPQVAYLNTEQAAKLRNVLHMATVSDQGICWKCLLNEKRATSL